MKNGKQTYAELLRERNRLQYLLDEARRAAAHAQMELVGYSVDRWVSVPLPECQQAPLRPRLLPLLAEASRDRRELWSEEAGVARYETIIRERDLPEGEFLAEYRAVLVRYQQSEALGIHHLVVWGLTPV